MKRLILVDAHALIHRAFHALPPLTSPDGRTVNAVYGVASILLKILRELSPDYAAAAFDSAGPTFRHIAYERYKAERVKAPDALYEQIPLVHELFTAFGIPQLEKQGYEADDIIGTIVAKIRSHHPDVEIIIVTGDLDALQLVDGQTKVFTMKKGIADTVLYDEAAVRERYGLSPAELVDFKGLRGDPSDNIPGVRGIGEKTASELLQAHGSVEALYKALRQGNVKARPAALEALKTHEADALFSRTLATIDRNVPITFALGQAKLRKAVANRPEVHTFLGELGFGSLIRRINGNATGKTAERPERESRPVPAVLRQRAPSSASDLPTPKAHSALVADGEAFIVAISPDEVIRFPRSMIGSAVARGWFSRKHPMYVFDLKPLLAFGIPSDPRLVRDLKIVSWLLEPGRREYTPRSTLKRGEQSAAPEDPTQIASELFTFAPVLEERLAAEELLVPYDTIEAPLIPILALMEQFGIGFDAKPLHGLARSMARELVSLEQKIHAAAGGAFNIQSPRQLAEILFGKLGLESRGIRKTEKSGSLSTRESELAKLKRSHPIVADILRYREIAKLKSTYVDSLPGLVAADGRIHTTWNQVGTATGRLSSANPNLQNIPIRGEFGPEIRKAFVAPRGRLLVAFDYSQLELRIAADLSGDEKMIDAFRKGIDIHRLTAAEMNNVTIDKVTPEMRYRAKALNFGVLYGMGSRAFAESAGVSRDEAEAFIEEYFRDFSGIAKFAAATREAAHTSGYTKTAFGHRRYYPGINASNFRIQHEMERMATNHPLQGTAAGIMKRAMIEVERALGAEGRGDAARLVLQVHDELVFEVDERQAADCTERIRAVMEGVWRGNVTMRVEPKQGKNWGEVA